MKKIASAVLAAVLAVTMTACSLPTRNNTSTGKEFDPNEQVTISVGGWPQENTVGYYKCEEQLKKFNELYPNITIEKDNWLYDVNSFLPKAASGQLPTLYNTWFTEADQVFGMGYAYDVTELLKKYDYDKNLRKEVLDLITIDGKMYGIPTGAHALGMIVNMNLFRQAGLVNDDGSAKIPKTFDELIETSKIIKEKTGKAGYVIPTTNNLGGWHFMPIAWGFGVKFMEQQENGSWKSTFDSPECIAAMQYISDLKWKYGVLPENAFVDKNEMQKLFATDQAAMYFSQDFQDGLINTYSMDRKNIGMGLIPEGKAGRYTLMGGTFHVISNTATEAQAEAAMKWLEFNGNTPNLTEEGKANIELSTRFSAGSGDDVKAAYEKAGKNINSNVIVGVPSFGQFKNDCEQKKFLDETKKKYANVDLNYFKDYVNFENVNLKGEEPVCCQQLYSILDGVLQSVLSNKDADIAKLIKDANDLFQKNYLDRME